MDGTNAYENNPGPSIIERPVNLKTNEDPMRILTDEVSDRVVKVNNPTNSDGKNTKKNAKNRNLSRKRKVPDHPPASKKDAKKTSRKQTRTAVVASPSTAEVSTNINTDEDSNIINTDEAPKSLNTINNQENSDKKNVKKSSKKKTLSSRRKNPDHSVTLETEVNENLLQNRASITALPRTVEYPSLTTDETATQEHEISNQAMTTNNPVSSDDKNAERPVENRRNSRKKYFDQPQTSEMVNAESGVEDRNTNSAETQPNVAETGSVLNRNEESMQIQTNQEKKIRKRKNPENSYNKIFKAPAKKLLREKLSLKRRGPGNPPTSQMVIEAIQALKKRNGASVDAILEYMEGQYRVNSKSVKRYVTRYMKSAVQKGIVEHLGGKGDDGRFKIKRAVKVAKDRKNNQKELKVVKKQKLK